MRRGIHSLVAGVALPVLFGCGSEPLQRGTDSATPLAATQENISFISEGLTLVGTLTVPARNAGERVPGVVLIAGSGPESRDEVLAGQLGMSFGFNLPVFEQLAAALTDAGFAVLRYDKRSCGTFNGCADNEYPLPPDSTTIEDYVADVDAALDFLESRTEVELTQVSVVGHSEGASYVPRLLESRQELQSGVMLSGPYNPIDVIIAQQTQFLEQLLTDAGTDPATITRDLAPLNDELAALALMRAGTYEGGSVGGAYPPFWTSLMALGDAAPATSAEVARPLLAVGGSYDWNVPLSELARWQDNFANSSNPDQRDVVALDCMTHALNCVAQPDYHLIQDADIGRTLDPDLAPAVVSFLRSH